MTLDLRDFLSKIEQLGIDAGALKATLPPAPVEMDELVSASDIENACETGGNFKVLSGQYLGNFVVKKPLKLFAELGVELFPLDPLLPTLFVPDASASGSEFHGLIIHNGAPDRECVVIGRYEATDASAQPSKVTIEGCILQAGPNGGHRGIALHGSNLSVIESHVHGYWEGGRDSQAIWIHNGPGPYLIDGCYLEASGENILSGGSSVKIPNCVPSDITIRNCQIVKPAAWKTNGATIKNSVEIKNGRRVLIENNAIDGWWPSGQGAPIQFTPRNQDGDCPWAIVEDVVFVGNTVKNASGGFAINILGTDNEYPSQQTRNITISRNLFQDASAGIQVLGGVTGALTISHNTFPAIKTKLFSFDRLLGSPDIMTPLHFTDNVLKAGSYGVTGDGSTAIGLASLLAFCELVEWSGNLIGGAASLPWPTGQAVLTNTALMALLDPVTFKTLAGGQGY